MDFALIGGRGLAMSSNIKGTEQLDYSLIQVKRQGWSAPRPWESSLRVTSCGRAQAIGSDTETGPWKELDP
jgi:hypothetical protein